ncbi:DNA repair protein RecN [Nocardioides sp. Soil805]|uniref:DNA repair protein RecN n=1 Tax=Nocardioides sp. Soil805 TaxID=1736416 RepID=UPI000702DEA8|nr:DNA repair protein RecN [Nocardioides sp. Soil805]KRF32465.1 DNA repair protein RecN [Nocardioides sp. Soil805]
MFEEIRISSLGVIESSTLELGPGLTVITGETGAGKTMVVTALALLLGGRADTGAVRSGSPHARVEGVVDASTLPGFLAAVDELGGDTEDGRVVVARNIAAEGRSRAWVGGASVPVSRMAEVTEPLVAVHGQSDQHRLLRAGAQRDALDRFAADRVDPLLARWQRLHAELVAVERDLDDVVTHARERALEADRLRFGLGEIEAVSPEPGEDTALAAEESRLGYADTLRTAAEQAREALSSDEDAPDALATTATARTLLEGVRDHDPEAGELADRLAELTYLLSDVAADVASYASRLDVDPARLAAVSERRAAITALMRKYGETVEDVLAWAQEGSLRLLDLDDADGRIATLRAEQERLRGELARTGADLSAARTAGAASLGTQVSAELTQLAMPHAVVTVAVTQHEVPEPERLTSGALQVGDRWLRATASGLDEVEFLLAANTGADPRPLHKGASGGELSRVMLALEVSLAGSNPVPTFVFDEVDAGVGGKAAIEIGRRLAVLAKRAQVLVVTHLPQVAAYADRHVVVHKQSDGTVTTSGLVVLDDAAREQELSRMLAGVEESDAARAHARELLESAAPARAGA